MLLLDEPEAASVCRRGLSGSEAYCKPNQRRVVGLLTIRSHLADESAHLILHGLKQTINLGGITLSQQLDAAVGKIADVTCHIETASKPAAGGAKSNALNPARIHDAASLKWHEITRKSVSHGFVVLSRSIADPRHRSVGVILPDSDDFQQGPRARQWAGGSGQSATSSGWQRPHCGSRRVLRSRPGELPGQGTRDTLALAQAWHPRQPRAAL